MKNYRYYCSKLLVIFFNGIYFLKLCSVLVCLQNGKKLDSKVCLCGAVPNQHLLPAWGSCIVSFFVCLFWILNFLGFFHMTFIPPWFGSSELRTMCCRSPQEPGKNGFVVNLSRRQVPHARLCEAGVEVQRGHSQTDSFLRRVLRDGDPSSFGISVAWKETIILGYGALDFGGCWEYTMEKRDPC